MTAGPENYGPNGDTGGGNEPHADPNTVSNTGTKAGPNTGPNTVSKTGDQTMRHTGENDGSSAGPSAGRDTQHHSAGPAALHAQHRTIEPSSAIDRRRPAPTADAQPKARALGRLLRPDTIAVIGGGTWCANVIRACEAIGYNGAIWPVHPTKNEIAGRHAFASITQLPSPPDASFVGINRHATVTAIEELSAAGAGGAVCFASGFAEADAELEGGANLQDRLRAAAGDMPCLGPNCYGFLNYLDGIALWPDQHGGLPVQSGVAVIAQSSNIALNITMQHSGLPLAYVVTVGNQALLDMFQIGAELLHDPRVTCLGLYIEGIHDIRALEALAHLAHELGKPICAIKTGTSQQAQAASISHTASLSGSAVGAAALLKRLGIAQAPNLSVFMNLLNIWHTAGPRPNTRIASASCSGGEASLMADIGLAASVQYPALNAGQTRALRASLGAQVALANPLDYNTYIWGDRAAMAATFQALFDADLALGIIVLDFPRADRCDQAEWDPVLDAIMDTACAVATPLAVVSSMPDTLPEPIAQRLRSAGVIALSGMDCALSAVSLSHCKPLKSSPIILPKTPPDPIILDEDRSKKELAEAGIRVPKSATAPTAHDAAQAARSLTPPFALKGLGQAHKTEAGLVALNLPSPEAVQDAARNMSCAGYLVEEMIESRVFELLIGVTLDPAHGYVLTVGAGGTLTELLNDTHSLILPVERRDIEHALLALKCGPVLTGYRGAPAADLDAICSAVEAVQNYVLAHVGRIQEVEINPLICTAQSAIAADALIIKGQAS